MDDFQDLDKGQLAYRDSDGSLIILPVNDDDIRHAFIRRLTLEYVEDRDLEELLERFKKSAQEAVNGDTKSVKETKEAEESA